MASFYMQSSEISQRSACGLDGTTLANTNIDTSSTHKSGRTGRGGARNSRSRTSLWLTVAQVEGLRQAVWFSWCVRMPLNRHVTINLAANGIEDRQAMAVISSFLEQMRRWLASQGGSFACIWVRETLGWRKVFGTHVHILMHCPREFARLVGARQRTWLRQAIGKPTVRGTFKTTRVAQHLAASSLQPSLYAYHLERVTDYLCKGIAPDGEHILCHFKRSNCGRVIGKRCGMTQNIAPAARRRALELVPPDHPARIFIGDEV